MPQQQEKKYSLPSIEIPIKPLFLKDKALMQENSPFFPKEDNSDRKSMCSRHREGKLLKILGGETQSDWCKGNSNDPNTISFGQEETEKQ